MTISLPSAMAPTQNVMLEAQQHQLKLDKLGKVEETAKEFEAVFLSEMMNLMFKEIKTDEMFGGGHGEDMFKSLMITEYGKEISNSGGIGIASEIQKAIIDLQEKMDNL